MRLSKIAALIMLILTGCTAEYYDELDYTSSALTLTGGYTSVQLYDDPATEIESGITTGLTFNHDGFECSMRLTSLEAENTDDTYEITSVAFGLTDEKMLAPQFIAFTGIGLTYDYLEPSGGGYYKPIFTIRNAIDGLYLKAGLCWLKGGFQLTTTATLGRSTFRISDSPLPNISYQYATVSCGASISF